MTVGQVVLSLAIGLVGSLLGWGLSQVVLGPLLSFSRHVLVRPSEASPTGQYVQVKMHNRSRLRSVVDIVVEARVAIPALDADRRRSYLIASSKTSSDELVRMPPRTVRRVTIFTDELTDYIRGRLSELGQETFAGRHDLQLLDLLEMRPADAGWSDDPLNDGSLRPYLRLSVQCADAWSGARRSRLSRTYRTEHVTDCDFVPASSRLVLALNHVANLVRVPHTRITENRGRHDRVLHTDWSAAAVHDEHPDHAPH